MFEYDNEIVESLLSENKDFERLYAKHSQLKQRVNELEHELIQSETAKEKAIEENKKNIEDLKDTLLAIKTKMGDLTKGKLARQKREDALNKKVEKRISKH